MSSPDERVSIGKDGGVKLAATAHPAGTTRFGITGRPA
jgi:hypothetical protein